MFTGIITDIGTVRKAEQKGDLRLTVGCDYDMDTVDLGASIACSGACLTVVDKGEDWFAVDVSQETVSKTAPGLWAEGARLNLERALAASKAAAERAEKIESQSIGEKEAVPVSTQQ